MWNKRPIIFFLVEYFGTQALKNLIFLSRSQSPSIVLNERKLNFKMMKSCQASLKEQTPI